MKFYITRTSLWSNEKPLEDSRVKFDDREDAWYIELNTLEELVNFADDVKDEIVLGVYSNIYGSKANARFIEIYDTWRE